MRSPSARPWRPGPPKSASCGLLSVPEQPRSPFIHLCGRRSFHVPLHQSSVISLLPSCSFSWPGVGGCPRNLYPPSLLPERSCALSWDLCPGMSSSALRCMPVGTSCFSSAEATTRRPDAIDAHDSADSIESSLRLAGAWPDVTTSILRLTLTARRRPPSPGSRPSRILPSSFLTPSALLIPAVCASSAHACSMLPTFQPGGSKDAGSTSRQRLLRSVSTLFP